jgi:hypothetical protein
MTRMAGKTVRLWEGVDKFGLVFEDENMDIVFRESQDFPFAFVVEIWEGEMLIEKELIGYDELEVRNIFELKEKILSNPEKVLEEILKRRYRIDRVIAW